RTQLVAVRLLTFAAITAIASEGGMHFGGAITRCRRRSLPARSRRSYERFDTPTAFLRVGRRGGSRDQNGVGNWIETRTVTPIAAAVCMRRGHLGSGRSDQPLLSDYRVDSRYTRPRPRSPPA